MFLDRVIHFGETLRDQVKGRSPKKLKSLIEVPNVVHVKVHVLSFNMILITPPLCVLTPSYPFLRETLLNFLAISENDPLPYRPKYHTNG